MARPGGLEGRQDVASGCLVGYDAATDLFFGHAPGAAGDDGALVGLSSDFVERRCLDMLCLRLEERRAQERDVADVPTTAGESDSDEDEYDCGTTVDSWTHPTNSPRPAEDEQPE